MIAILAASSWKLLLMAGLLFLSAFFSGSESALFSLTRRQLREIQSRRNPACRAVVQLHNDPRALLVTVLLGNMIVNILFYCLAYSATRAFVEGGYTLAGAAFSLIALTLVILCGEIGPKTVAVMVPVTISLLAAPFLLLFMRVSAPLRYVLEKVAHVAHWIASRLPGSESYVTAEEIEALIDLARSEGRMDTVFNEMLHEVLDLSDRAVKEIMIPRVDMTAFRLSRPREELHELIRSSRRSLIPVYGRDIDDVKGVVSSREVLLYPDRRLATMIRRIPFVPETKTAVSLLQEFRGKGTAAAFVVDEYGGLAGFVTLEDVVEEIIGEIEDEHPRDVVPQIEQVSEREWIVDGRMSVRRWAEITGARGLENYATTLTGLIAELLGRIPREGDSICTKNIEMTVESMKGRRIDRLRVRIHPPHEVMENKVDEGEESNGRNHRSNSPAKRDA